MLPQAATSRRTKFLAELDPPEQEMIPEWDLKNWVGQGSIELLDVGGAKDTLEVKVSVEDRPQSTVLQHCRRIESSLNCRCRSSFDIFVYLSRAKKNCIRVNSS